MWIALAAAAATTFNLNCTVRTAAGPLNSPVKQSPTATPPKTLIFSIDLARLRWCSDDCELTKPIISVTPAEIILQQDVSNSGGSSTRLNRETGEFIQMIVDNETTFTVLTGGKCEVTPFTGMPEPKF